MPTRLTLTLQGEAPSFHFGHSKALQALAYQWIATASKSTAAELHDGKRKPGMKPFSIAPLRLAGTSSANVDITCVDDAIAPLLLEGAAKHQGALLLKSRSRLHRYADFSIDQASSVSWNRMLMSAKPASAWRVMFLSPTATKVKGVVDPHPSAEAVFSSWFYRWQNFAPMKLELDCLERVKSNMRISYIEGETSNVDIAFGQKPYQGFSGVVEYKIDNPADVNKSVLKTLDLLALFSEYAGTGTQTMRGMGVTRTVRLKEL